MPFGGIRWRTTPLNWHKSLLPRRADRRCWLSGGPPGKPLALPAAEPREYEPNGGLFQRWAEGQGPRRGVLRAEPSQLPGPDAVLGVPRNRGGGCPEGGADRVVGDGAGGQLRQQHHGGDQRYHQKEHRSRQQPPRPPGVEGDEGHPVGAAQLADSSPVVRQPEMTKKTPRSRRTGPDRSMWRRSM